MLLSGGVAAIGMLGGHFLASHFQKKQIDLEKETFMNEIPLIVDRIKGDFDLNTAI